MVRTRLAVLVVVIVLLPGLGRAEEMPPGARPARELYNLLMEMEKEIETKGRELAEQFTGERVRQRVRSAARKYGGRNLKYADQMAADLELEWKMLERRLFFEKRQRILRSAKLLFDRRFVRVEEIDRFKRERETWRTEVVASEGLLALKIAYIGKFLNADKKGQDDIIEKVAVLDRVFQTIGKKKIFHEISKEDPFRRWAKRRKPKDEPGDSTKPPGAPRGPTRTPTDTEIQDHIQTLGHKDVFSRKKAILALVRAGPAAVPALTEALGHEDQMVRQNAAFALGRIGPPAKAAVPKLKNALKVEKYGARRMVAVALATIDAESSIPLFIKELGDGWDTAWMGLATIGPDAVPALVRAFKRGGRKVRTRVSMVLQDIGPLASEATPVLIEALEDPEENEIVRDDAADALGILQASEAVPTLLAVLGDEDEPWLVRYSAMKALIEIRSVNREVVPPLVEALLEAMDSEEWRTRDWAAEGLGYVGPDAREAVPHLIEALDDEHGRVRRVVAYTLGKIGPAAREAVPRLREALAEPKTAAASWVALGKITGKPEAYVPALLDAVRGADAGVRSRAFWALAQVGPKAKAAVPELQGLYKARSDIVRISSIQALGAIGPDAKPAVDGLKFNLNYKGMGSPYLEVWLWANYALARISDDPEPYVRSLIDSLSDQGKCFVYRGSYRTDGLIRREAAEALGRIGPAARAAVPRLVEMALYDSDDLARQEAIEVLGRIGAEAKVAVPALIEIVESSYFLSSVASEALGKFGPEARAAVPILVRTLKHYDLDARRSAAEALAKIGPASVSALIGALEDPHPYSGFYAARALGQMGPEAREAVPALRRMAREARLPLLRRAAADALKKLEAGADSALPGPAKPPTDTEIQDHIQTLGHKDVFSRKKAILALVRAGPAAVPALTEALGHEDQMVRQNAAFVLGRIGPPAKAAVPALRKAFSDERRRGAWVVLSKVAVALAAIDPKPSIPLFIKHVDNVWSSGLAKVGPDAVPALVRLLKEGENVGARWRVGYALNKIGPPAAEAVPALVEALKDPEKKVRGGAAYALTNIPAPEAAPALFALLSDEDEDEWTRLFAAEALARARAVPYLVEAMDIEEIRIRRLVAHFLGEVGPAAREAVPRLIEALDDENARVRELAARALGNIGPDAREAVPYLREVLAEPKTAAASWVALGKITGKPEAYVLAFLDAVRDADALTRSRALWALTQVGPKAKAAVPELQGLKTRDDIVRVSTIQALGAIGPDAKPAVDGLKSDLNYKEMGSPYLEIWLWANYALARISDDPEPYIRSLIDSLSDQGKCFAYRRGFRMRRKIPVRIEAARALGKIGPAARAAVPRLAEMALSDSSFHVRGDAIIALGEIGAEPEVAVPALIDSIETNFEVFYFLASKASEALGKFGPEARAAVPILVRTLKHFDLSARRSAAEALAKIGPASVPALIGALEDPHPYSGFYAARALGQMGPEAREAVPALRRMAREARLSVLRRAAADALKKLEAGADSALPGPARSLGR